MNRSRRRKRTNPDNKPSPDPNNNTPPTKVWYKRCRPRRKANLARKKKRAEERERNRALRAGQAAPPTSPMLSDDESVPNPILEDHMEVDTTHITNPIPGNITSIEHEAPNTHNEPIVPISSDFSNGALMRRLINEDFARIL